MFIDVYQCFAYMYVHVLHACSTHEGQKETLAALELELQLCATMHHVGN